MNAPSINWSWLSRLLPVSLLLLNLQVGCSPHIAAKPPTPLSQEIRAQLGTIAIASKPLSTPFASPSPPSGWAQGFSQGVKTGAYYGAWPGLVIVHFVDSGPPPAIMTMTTGLGLSTAGGAMGGLIGGPVGAFQASSEQSVEQAMAILGKVPGELQLTDLLRDSVIQLVRDETSYDVMVLQTSEIPAPEDHTGYQALLDKGIGSLLEIDLLEVGLTQGIGMAYDPPLRISLSVKTRLIRIEDGTEIDSRVIAFDERSVDDFVRMEPSDGGRPFSDWVSHNGRLFREELPRTAQHLAEKIVETLLLLQPIQTKTSR